MFCQFYPIFDDNDKMMVMYRSEVLYSIKIHESLPFWWRNSPMTTDGEKQYFGSFWSDTLVFFQIRSTEILLDLNVFQTQHILCPWMPQDNFNHATWFVRTALIKIETFLFVFDLTSPSNLNHNNNKFSILTAPRPYVVIPWAPNSWSETLIPKLTKNNIFTSNTIHAP